MKTDEFVKQFIKVFGYDTKANFYSFKPKNSQWIYKKEKVDFKKLLSHFYGNMIVSLPRKYDSRIFYIDVDYIEGEVSPLKKIDFLVDQFGEPLYLEYSRKSQSYHIAFRFDRYVHFLAWEHFSEVMHKQNPKRHYTFEPLTTKRTLRLPMSSDYSIFGEYDKNRWYHIHRLSKEEVLERFKDKNCCVVPLPKYLTYYKRLVKTTKYQRYRLVKLQETFDKFSSLRTDIQSFFYGKGNRNEVQYKIALYVLKKGYGFEEFKNLCEFYNVNNSKDMDQPEFQKMKMLKSIWEWAVQNEYKNYLIDVSPLNQSLPTVKKKRNRKPAFKTYVKKLVNYAFEKYKDIDVSEAEEKLLEEIIKKYYPLDRFSEAYKPKKIKEILIYTKRFYLFLKRYVPYVVNDLQIKYHIKYLKPFEGTLPLSKKFFNVIYDIFLIRNKDKILQMFLDVGILEKVYDEYGREYDETLHKVPRHYKFHTLDEIKLTKSKIT